MKLKLILAFMFTLFISACSTQPGVCPGNTATVTPNGVVCATNTLSDESPLPTNGFHYFGGSQ